jgi:hypothetical protein
MESLEHWDFFYLIRLIRILYRDHSLIHRTKYFNTKNGILLDIAIDNFIKKNINMTLMKRHLNL